MPRVPDTDLVEPRDGPSSPLLASRERELGRRFGAPVELERRQLGVALALSSKSSPASETCVDQPSPADMTSRSDLTVIVATLDGPTGPEGSLEAKQMGAQHPAIEWAKKAWAALLSRDAPNAWAGSPNRVVLPRRVWLVTRHAGKGGACSESRGWSSVRLSD